MTLSIVLTEEGVPVSLTSATVTMNLYSVNGDLLKWSHVCTIDDAANGLAHLTSIITDFNTVGDFYSTIVVTKTSYSKTYQGEGYRVIEYQWSEVTPGELLQFVDIPTENAKPNETIQLYIDQAESALLLEVPFLTTTTNQKYLQRGRNLILIRAATVYFMNSGESNINPDIRMQKIKLWTEEFNNACDKLNSVLASTSDSDGVVRRVTNTSEDVESPLTEDYYP